MMNGQQPQTIDLRQEVSVTLNLATWNNVLACIVEAPWKTADPLMTEIRRQLALVIDAPKLPADRPTA